MANTGFTINGTDVSNGLVTKDFLLDRYPDLYAQYRTAGIYVLGWDYYGFRADGSNGTATKYSSPVQCVSGEVGWKTLATHVGIFAQHTAAIKNDGSLWLWGGANGYGVLGNGTTAGNYSPVQTTAGGTNWKQVSVSYYGTAAIKTDGTMWTWGYGTSGASGTGTNTNKSTPVQIGTSRTWRQVTHGGSWSAAVADEGTLWVWGRNGYDGMGEGATGAGYSTPVQTSIGGSDWKQVSAGQQSGGAVKTDGTLWMWGNNQNGIVGNNNRNSPISTPVQTIAAGTNWKKIACGQNFSSAIKTDGTLWTWGSNSYGQLGVGDTNARSSPTQVAGGGTNWQSITVRWIGGISHPTALKTDGTLWLWGNNTWGQLGTGDTNDRYSPTQVAVGGTNWKQVSAGYRVSVLLRDDTYDFGAGTL